jgi:small-conductance mechanosensitive channel
MLIIIAQAVLIFFALNAFYWLLYKYLAWRGSFIQPVAVRVRFWVYLLIPLCTLNWLGTRLYQDALVANSMKSWITWLPRYCITTLLIIIVAEALLVFIFDYVYAHRRQVEVPQVIQSFVRALAYLLVALLVMLNLFNIKIVAGVLVGSAVLLFGLGLLMQDALTNLFAGFSLQVTRFYGPGDWLRVGQYEGRVESTDWRSLTIRTANGDLITLPLSQLSKVEVIHLSAKDTLHADEVEMTVEYATPPEQVERALRGALRDVDGIAAEPAPETRLLAFGDHGVRYALKYWIADYAQRDAVATAVHRAVWYHFRRSEIRFAHPAADVTLHQQAPCHDTTEERIRLLEGIRFLQILTPEQMRQLASSVHLCLFARGETLCRQGEPGQTFYILTRGRVRVSAVTEAGVEMFAQDLHVGSFFGEFSLMTGEPRTATVTATVESEMLVIDKEDMRLALAANPQLAEHISTILAQRRLELQESRARAAVAVGAPVPEPDTEDNLRREILAKIVSFFSY